KFTIVMRGSEPAPVAQNMDLRSRAEHRPLADAGEPGITPRRRRIRRERCPQSRGVCVCRLCADACAGAAMNLARETGADASLESKRSPAERVLAGEPTQRLTR